MTRTDHPNLVPEYRFPFPAYAILYLGLFSYNLLQKRGPITISAQLFPPSHVHVFFHSRGVREVFVSVLPQSTCTGSATECPKAEPFNNPVQTEIKGPVI